jgi:hypothetical protein
MFETVHTILHILGICPDSVGFIIANNYITYAKHLIITFKNIIL